MIQSIDKRHYAVAFMNIQKNVVILQNGRFVWFANLHVCVSEFFVFVIHSILLYTRKSLCKFAVVKFGNEH